MEYVLSKLLLPLIIPLLTALLKQVIDKVTPIALEKVPKPLFGAVALILGGLPPLISPDLFVLPGLPSSASVALYGLAAMGVREIVDQSIKLVGPSPTTPPGI